MAVSLRTEPHQRTARVPDNLTYKFFIPFMLIGSYYRSSCMYGGMR